MPRPAAACNGFDNALSFRYLDLMQELLASHGYAGLFALSFLASTLLPLGSEWLLVVMLLNRFDPLLVVTVATVGNCLGACTTYLIGLYGSSAWFRLLRIEDGARARAEGLYGRYGSWSLLFSWVPVVGDPLCLAGGIMQTRFAHFFLLVAAGKLARYAAVAWVALATCSPAGQS
jgi:membrane protein YqaA with SNARE-associated domain